MTPNESKSLRQEGIVNKWASNNGRGILLACTGFGKTRTGLKAIQLCLSRNPNRVVHVVVPSIKLKHDWERQIADLEIKNTFVFVANTYVNQDRHCSLLVCDEVHNYSNADAIVFSKIVLNTRYSFFLGLSATLDSDRIAFLAQQNINIVDVVTLAEARSKKWVSDFKVLCVGVDLNDNDRETYNKMHQDFNKYFAIFNHDFDLAMSCMKAEGAKAYSETLSKEWDEKEFVLQR